MQDTVERRRSSNPPTRPLVLLVDGNEDTLALYAIALSGMGFEVTAVGEAAEAFSHAWKVHPDIIVTGLVGADKSGWDLLRHLKGEPRTRDIPVVVVTGDALPATHERARREGCAAVLVTPCLPDRLFRHPPRRAVLRVLPRAHLDLPLKHRQRATNVAAKARHTEHRGGGTARGM